MLDRKTPIAQIVPLSATPNRAESDEDRLARLERKGVLRRGKGGSMAWLLRRRPSKLGGPSIVEELLKERESGW